MIIRLLRTVLLVIVGAIIIAGAVFALEHLKEKEMDQKIKTTISSWMTPTETIVTENLATENIKVENIKVEKIKVENVS